MEEQQLTSIFYADDDVDDLDFFKEALLEIDKPVCLFEEGDKLLKSLHNPPPRASVIFLDLNMPVKSGFDVLREIKASANIENVPVVIFTTSSNPADIELCKKMGANLYIRKPASVGALRKAINYVLSIDWENFNPTDKEFLYLG
ncbi:response regulator [Flavobacterium wongokense]|uniref:response regulator n=1 Tax=Flavobacterium wongokense TaxID=2910674 RepID=UPI001F1C5D63|nr:response regulator [Flavobacterium sp. WG47]MCF6131838.1 response regulator [Flavobacterium sp. WG47]